MSKSEAKKDHILCHGLEIMKANGYNGTSIKDIVEAAGVPKGSFYNYFDSKEIFAIEAIKKAAVENYQLLSSILRNSATPPLERLQQFFLLNVDNACNGDFKVGCFIGNMCQEMSDNCDAIRAKVKNAMDDLTALITEVLIQAQNEGSLAEDRDPALTAEFLFNAWEGALMRMKSSKCRDPLDAFIKMLPVIYGK